MLNLVLPRRIGRQSNFKDILHVAILHDTPNMQFYTTQPVVVWRIPGEMGTLK